MFHGLILMLFAAELVWLATGLPLQIAIFFAYPALSFAVIGLAYLLGRPALLGKRADGRFRLAFRLLHAPFHVVAALSARLRAMRSGEHWNEIADGIWLGARTGTVPPGTERIIDLTVEHARIGPEDVDYILIPTLDGQRPDRTAVVAAIDKMLGDPRPTYVHCFAGRGRSATVVAAYLIAAGVVQRVEEAESLLQERRPVVRLGSTQRALARTFEAGG